MGSLSNTDQVYKLGSLDSLPNEVVSNIYSKMSPKSKRVFGSTSKTNRAIYKNQLGLQHLKRIEEFRYYKGLPKLKPKTVKDLPKEKDLSGYHIYLKYDCHIRLDVILHALLNRNVKCVTLSEDIEECKQHKPFKLGRFFQSNDPVYVVFKNFFDVEVMNFAKSLKYLKITKTNIEHLQFTQIAGYEELESFVYSRNFRDKSAQDRDILNVLARNPNIWRLSLKQTSIDEKFTLNKIMYTNPYITHFNFSGLKVKNEYGSYERLQDINIVKILHDAKHIMSINLDHSQISNVTLVGLTNNNQFLKRISLLKTYDMDLDVGLKYMLETRDLQYINIDCNMLNYDVIELLLNVRNIKIGYNSDICDINQVSEFVMEAAETRRLTSVNIDGEKIDVKDLLNGSRESKGSSKVEKKLHNTDDLTSYKILELHLDY